MKRNLTLLILGFFAGMLVTNHWMVPRIVEAKQAADRSNFRSFVLSQKAFYEANPYREVSIQSYELAVSLHSQAILEGYPDEIVWIHGAQVGLLSWRITQEYCNPE